MHTTEFRNEETDLLSVSDVATILSLPRWKVYRWLKSTHAPIVQRRGRRIFTKKQDLEAFLPRQEVHPEPIKFSEQTSDPSTAVPPVEPRPDRVPPPARDLDRNESRSCGQRELILPRRPDLPRFVVFTRFEFM